MLGKALKQAKKAIESLYDSTCVVSRYEKSKDPITKETKSLLNVKHTNIICRVSRSRLSKNSQSDTINHVNYELKLITTVEVDIIQGDTIEVTNKFGTYEKYLSGEGFKYSTHQEVVLEKDGKA